MTIAAIIAEFKAAHPEYAHWDETGNSRPDDLRRIGLALGDWWGNRRGWSEEQKQKFVSLLDSAIGRAEGTNN